MKIVFMGTPDFSVKVLEELTKKHEVVGVYTREPKESGRGKKVNKTPIHLLAESKGIIVRTPKTLRDIEEQKILKSFEADVCVVAAYGMLLPEEVLMMFPKGCINVHASLLPRWRGAAPIQRAVEAGDAKSGISIMQMVKELDAGDVYSQREVEIHPNMTGGELHDALSKVGAELLIETLDKLDYITPLKQDEAKVVYAQKIDKSECKIDFNESGEIILRKIRAFSPYPSMYFMYEGERFKIFGAKVASLKGKCGEILKGKKELVIATSDSAIEVTKIQRQGKQVMEISELLKGFQFNKGEKV